MKRNTKYTTGQIAEILGYDTKTVISWCDNEELPCDRLPSGHRRIWHDDLIVFLKTWELAIPQELEEE